MYRVVSGSGCWCEQALQEQNTCDVGGVHAGRRIATAQDMPTNLTEDGALVC